MRECYLWPWRIVLEVHFLPLIFWQQGNLFRNFARFFCEVCRYKLKEYHDNVGFAKEEVRSMKDGAQAGAELLTSPHDTCINDHFNERRGGACGALL